jgi:hypothetical protein
MSEFTAEEMLDSALSEIQKAKVAVIQNACGICSLPEPEFYEALEKIYWLGFKAGHDKAIESGTLQGEG